MTQSDLIQVTRAFQENSITVADPYRWAIRIGLNQRKRFRWRDCKNSVSETRLNWRFQHIFLTADMKRRTVNRVSKETLSLNYCPSDVTLTTPVTDFCAIMITSRNSYESYGRWSREIRKPRWRPWVITFAPFNRLTFGQFGPTSTSQPKRWEERCALGNYAASSFGSSFIFLPSTREKKIAFNRPPPIAWLVN